MISSQGKFTYGNLIVAAGSNADNIAHLYGLGLKYKILPFKGLYWKLTDEIARSIRGAIYPTPNVNLPFLGVHFTRSVTNEVLLGPTALPALGRENYGVLEGLDYLESPRIFYDLASMWFNNKNNFRNLVRAELPKLFKSGFVKAAQELVPSLETKQVIAYPKVGIRAQLVNVESKTLEMDFIVERTDNTTHVLNTISPAFTSAFALGDLVTKGM